MRPGCWLFQPVFLLSLVVPAGEGVYVLVLLPIGRGSGPSVFTIKSLNWNESECTEHPHGMLGMAFGMSVSVCALVSVWVCVCVLDRIQVTWRGQSVQGPPLRGTNRLRDCES